MTKDWDAVQEEIKELSFNQKKSLEEVKELMERKHNFRASTRAYRMKLKEWGLMRHKPRRTVKEGLKATGGGRQSRTTEISEPHRERDSSATIEPLSTESTPPAARENIGGWKIAIDGNASPEPTFMGLLSSEQDLRPTLDPLSQARNRASGIVLDMLSAILDNNSQTLEKLIVENVNHVNDPIGEPFDNPTSRFFGHPALDQMVILQHPDQTLLDIACGMPCGPIIWVLLSHGAKGSRHPLGTDLALHNAIKNGRPYTVQALLVPGRSKVNGESESSWRPLRQAVFWNVPDVVRILLNRGANVDDAGPSPLSMRDHTALELCLEYRSTRYDDAPNMEKCHQVLKMLLDAGASVHSNPQGSSSKSPFELFIKPWQDSPYWAPKLTPTELDALRIFVSKGASSQAHFDGFPCGSPTSKKFEHQLLWHSTPSIARLLIDSIPISPHSNECSLLYEVLGSCPDAKRHPTDTLRDIEVLLQKGVNPNLADMDGRTPLMKCIMLCPAVDLVARLRVLLEGGAWPEFEDYTGVPAYVYAARTFEEPLLSEVMEILVSNITGRLDRLVDGVSHAWADCHFPIAETQTYEQVMSCTKQTGGFMLNMRGMVPEDAQSSFQRAYFNIISKKYLDTRLKMVTKKAVETKEKKEIVWIISMRKSIGLPDHSLDQELLVALLDSPSHSSMLLDTPTASTVTGVDSHAASIDTIPSPGSTFTATTVASMATHAPFSFNPNSTITPEEQSSAFKRPEEIDSTVEDFFAPSTTQIRWKTPDARPKPGDFDRAVEAVLQFECKVCGGGTLLTKNELKKHGVEHAHAERCRDMECTRRFCIEKQRTEKMKERQDKEPGCQNHLFGGQMDGIEETGCNPGDTVLDISIQWKG